MRLADRWASHDHGLTGSCLSVHTLRLQLRCYRLWWFFSFLTYSLATPLLLVTLLRNVLVSLWTWDAHQCCIALPRAEGVYQCL